MSDANGNPKNDNGFETRAIHAGAEPDPTTGARQTPIFQNTSYTFYDTDHAASLFNLQTPGFIYSRLANPTVAVLEERMANLEGGRGATCAASGHAAQLLAFFPLMEPGDEFIASTRLYGGSITQLGKTFRKFDWHANFVDVDDPDEVRRAVGTKTKAIFVESLANPGGVVSDLEALSAVAHEAGIPLIVDNTLATPYLCSPIEWGADLVVHSTTKFLSGNGTSMGGVVVDSGNFDWNGNDKYRSLSAPESAYHGLTFAETFGDMAFTVHSHAVGLRDLGPCMAPMNAFLTLLGIETLALRMERHVENALAVARFLDADDRVTWVSYAGLPDDGYHELANKYLPKGAGSVFTFGVKGGYDAGLKVVESVELFSHLANVGDARSLILHPASTTHRQLTEEQRAAAGAGNDVVRLSIGLESVEDVIADLDRALAASQA
jgi:O-acetylhomoserine (thiol)-lyase